MFHWNCNGNPRRKDGTLISKKFNDVKQYTATEKKEIYTVGERIGQIVFVDIPKIKLIEVEKLSDSVRGKDCFGSTGF